MLVEKLKLKRDLSRNPLFDVMFILQNVGKQGDISTDLVVSPHRLEKKVAKFDLTLNAMEMNSGISFELEYCTDLFKKESIERFIAHFEQIISVIINNPEIKLAEIEMLSAKEKEEILRIYNDTYLEYAKDKTIQQLFEEQVTKTPEEIALAFEDQELTYDELNQRANQVACHLRKMGVGANQFVGLMVTRSLELIIGMLGILKAGPAYLPIDPEYPQERINYMLHDSNTEILLSERDLIREMQFAGTTVDLQDENLFSEETQNPVLINNAEDLAYIIYTSGSTGKPKGVMIEHRSVNNFIQGVTQKFKFTSGQTLLSLTTVSFDIFVLETLLPLTKGIKVVLANAEEQIMPDLLNKALLENNVDLLQLTPSRMQLLLNSGEKLTGFRNLTNIMLGGEALPQGLLERLKLVTKAKIYNMYGPTETTVWSTIKDLTDVETVTIGQPIANTRIYILDKNLKAVPKNIVGDLYIVGDGLARGYLSQPDLTSEKFTQNPFTKERMYKTGDLARWNYAGDLEFIGRADQQVKIRGYRIEIGEIETFLASHPEIMEAVVIAREDQLTKTKYLCAYFVADVEFSIEDLREYLKAKLPDSMIPSYFISLESLPLTPNGKIDRKALPASDQSVLTKREYIAPTDEIEEKLARIWGEILGVAKIGIYDNFFELGGHSLNATSMIAEIYKELNVNLPLREVFKHPIIKELAEYIKTTEKSNYYSIPIVEKAEYYSVSSAQKRLFILNQFENVGTGYNMPMALSIEGELDYERLLAVFNQLINRHETLRTSFELISGEVMQIVHPKVEFTIHQMKLKDQEFAKTQIDKTIKDFIQPFDLGTALLLRAGLLQTKDQQILIVDMHHIISDGTSLRVLAKEFIELYTGVELLDLRVQYKDFAVWQNDLFASEKFSMQEEYWLDNFSGELPVLNLPTDFTRPAVRSFAGDRVELRLDEERSQQLKRFTTKNGITLYMLLLASYNILLAKYTGQEDIIIGSPIAGRPHADLKNIIGMFVNTLAIRNYPESQKSLADFLREIQDNVFKAFENQDYQLEMLIEKLDQQGLLLKDFSRNPLFDTMFILQNLDTPAMSVDNRSFDTLRFSPYQFERKLAKFDLSLEVVEVKHGMEIIFEYSTKLFKTSTIKRLANHYINILTQIINNPEMQLSEIEVISKEEKDQLLFEFNNTKAEYPSNQTIQHLFAKQVQKDPEGIALVYKEQQMTYAELNKGSNRLAQLLKTKGVAKDQIVAVMVENSFEMIIGLLAILKAGGAYLPIDVDYPRERIQYLLNDTEAKLLLTRPAYMEQIEFAGEVINIEDTSFDQRDSVIEITGDSNDLAYVIYTSGSTGKPKGVMVEHRGVINLFYWFNQKYNFAENRNMLQVINYTFDPSVVQIFGILVFGGTLYLIKKEERLDKDFFIKYIQEKEINIIHMVPTAIKELLLDTAKIESVKKVISGGEKLSEEFKNEILAKGYELYNHYGPTESTVTVLSSECTLDNKIVLGTPISNVRCYILDQNQKIVPLGVWGRNLSCRRWISERLS